MDIIKEGILIMEEICRLTNHEATQVYELIEKRNALSNLKKLLEVKEKNKYLYCQCKNDYDKINEMYQMWWENIIEKYQLGTCVEERLIVDVVGEKIMYQ